MSTPAWFGDDAFWESLDDFFSQFRTSQAAVREAEQIIALSNRPQGAALLDLCWGPGTLYDRAAQRLVAVATRSRAIPKRLGFYLEGVARQAEWLHDHFVDLAVYALPRAEVPGGAEAEPPPQAQV